MRLLMVVSSLVISTSRAGRLIEFITFTPPSTLCALLADRHRYLVDGLVPAASVGSICLLSRLKTSRNKNNNNSSCSSSNNNNNNISNEKISNKIGRNNNNYNKISSSSSNSNNKKISRSSNNNNNKKHFVACFAPVRFLSSSSVSLSSSTRDQRPLSSEVDESATAEGNRKTADAAELNMGDQGSSGGGGQTDETQEVGRKSEKSGKSGDQITAAAVAAGDSSSAACLLQVAGSSTSGAGDAGAGPLEPPSPTLSRTSSEGRTTSCLGGSCKKPHTKSPPDSPAERDDRPKDDFISNLSNFFSRKLGFASDRENADAARANAGPTQPAHFLEEPTIESVVKYIKSDKCRNIIFMVGAGISTAAGIPDFRSPSTGLYTKLSRFNLPCPEAIFDISYFRRNPAPFFELAKELLPQKLKPTKAHHFLKLMHDKGLLLRLYTQNIDTLEREAGIPEAKLVEAHGTFHTSHCLNCRKSHTFEWMKSEIAKPDTIPKCTKCGGVVKPDIVFFGENLPERFYRLADEDFAKCDLLVIIGTSLQVQPFAGLVDRVHSAVPRLLINLEKCGHNRDLMSRLLTFGCGLDFDSENNYRDVALLGTCDDGCEELARRLGWQAELERVISDYEKSLPAD